MAALVLADDLGEEQQLAAEPGVLLGQRVELGLEVLEGERVVEDRQVALGQPAALGERLGGHQAQQRRAAEQAAAEDRGLLHRGRARERLVLGLADRAVRVDGLEIKHRFHLLSP